MGPRSRMLTRPTCPQERQAAGELVMGPSFLGSVLPSGLRGSGAGAKVVRVVLPELLAEARHRRHRAQPVVQGSQDLLPGQAAGELPAFLPQALAEGGL